MTTERPLYADPEMYSSTAGVRRTRLSDAHPTPDRPADTLGSRTAEVPVEDLSTLLEVLRHAQGLLRRAHPVSAQPVAVSRVDGMLRLDGLVFATRYDDEIEMGVGFRQLAPLIADLEALQTSSRCN